jgi:hypothetical protein
MKNKAIKSSLLSVVNASVSLILGVILFFIFVGAVGAVYMWWREML